MVFPHPLNEISSLRQKIVNNTAVDENTHINYLLSIIKQNKTSDIAIQQLSSSLVQQVRDRQLEQHGMLAFIRQYNLSTEEGVVLMCLAEALLRIPDAATANKLIKDKLTSSDWRQHLGASHSLFVNASTWGLMLTGKLVQLQSNVTSNVNQYLNSFISKSSEPVIRAALKEAMRFMGQQFVISETIEAATTLSNNKNQENLYSFDMLGEAAITNSMAEQYFKSYLQAINAIATKSNNTKLNYSNSISIKLSALHPRYEYSQQHNFTEQLYPRLKKLIERAIEKNVALTIDAEEANRLDIMLDAFEYLYNIAITRNWNGLGLAVQAYQFRSVAVIKWLDEISSRSNCVISVRLVKGAYWDTEIKIAQQLGLDYYPVFSRKQNTDLSYLCCAQLLLDSDYIYPQFATHNAHTIASIITYAEITEQTTYHSAPCEFQRLFGMGDLLYDSLLKKYKIPCRVYAPVGEYKSLLPYLVRRLLENGANTSFVQRIEDHSIDIATIIESPIAQVNQNKNHYHPNIPLPCNVLSDKFQKNSVIPDSKNHDNRILASGLNLTHLDQLTKLDGVFKVCYSQQFHSKPQINDSTKSGSTQQPQFLKIYNPANLNDFLGEV
ncbi:MAG: proline dehydrogenase family protein, partial [Gammaproteobacteria bacterium]